jgi:hypothetical protein
LSKKSSAIAPRPERKLATCQLLRLVALIAEPPVENRSALARIAR